MSVSVGLPGNVPEGIATLDLPHNLEDLQGAPSRTHSWKGDDLPPPVKGIVDNPNAPSEMAFNMAACFYNYVCMATMNSPPMHGGPLVGFEPLVRGERVLFKHFCTMYYNGNHKETRFLSLEELMKLEFTCQSDMLANAIGEVDAAAGERAKNQVRAVRSMLSTSISK